VDTDSQCPAQNLLVVLQVSLTLTLLQALMDNLRHGNAAYK